MLGRLVFFISIVLIPALKAETYVIGAQDFNYYPHYDFTASGDKGFVWAVLQAFSEKTGHQFQYQAMPVKRLQMELNKGEVDLIYPDNPVFYPDGHDNPDKIYSDTLVHTLGGTIVKPWHLGRRVGDIRCISLPLGFTPQVGWQQLVSNDKLDLVKVQDSYSALRLVDLGRVDAADVDYFVSQFISQKDPTLGQFTLDPALPSAVVEFKFAAVSNSKLIEQLNQFIRTESALIETLKAHYGLEEPTAVLERLQSRSDSQNTEY